MTTKRPRTIPRASISRRTDDDEISRPLTFSPLAWLKFQFLCHAGPTEVGGFGLSADNDPLYLEDVILVRQKATAVTVSFDDGAVADLFDAMADAGIAPNRFARIWLHTHPGASVDPSVVDEETFRRAFGGCDWAVMAILGRTGRTSARLKFNVGPGAAIELRTTIDWSSWPNVISGGGKTLQNTFVDWQKEYAELVETTHFFTPDSSLFQEDFPPVFGSHHDLGDLLQHLPKGDLHEFQ